MALARLRIDLRTLTRLIPALLSTLALLPTGGCNRNQKENLMIPDVPFGHYKAIETPAMPKVSSATTESAIRAGKMGQKIVEANKEFGIRPSIHTIGGDQIEVFHRGQDQIFMTEGLVNQASDPQLAAVISMEMAKMVAEREALEGPMTRNFESAPPQEVVMFEDRGGSFGAPDGTHLAEMAKYERRRGGPRRAKLKLPDPPVLATAFLKKSGFGPEALASAQPLLQKAQEQSTFEKQMRGSGVVPVEARSSAPPPP